MLARVLARVFARVLARMRIYQVCGDATAKRQLTLDDREGKFSLLLRLLMMVPFVGQLLRVSWLLFWDRRVFPLLKILPLAAALYVLSPVDNGFSIGDDVERFEGVAFEERGVRVTHHFRPNGHLCPYDSFAY